MSSKVVAGLVAACSLLAACGGSDASKPYVDALMRSPGFVASSSSHLTTKQKRCEATHIVDAVGVAALRDAHVTPAVLASRNGLQTLGRRLTDRQADAVAGVIVSSDCYDATAAFLAQAGPVSVLPASKARCVVAHALQLPAERHYVASLITGRGSAPNPLTSGSALFTVLGTCGVTVQDLQGGA